MQVNIGYAYGQLVRAREKGDAKSVTKWQAVVDGMRVGSIKVGSRTPIKAPAPVTLDVVTGGFATGTYAAGGPLRAHEGSSRAAANLAFLESSDADALLASGHYRIDVPEEGALLVVAWLRARGETAQAAAIVDEISPWIETLRFFPTRAARPLEVRETVRVQDLGATVDELDVDGRQLRFETMRDAELVWKPLRDRAMALWLETLDGEVPRVVGGAVTGGCLARTFPSGWRAWVHALVADCRAVKSEKTKRAYEVIVLVEQLARVATHPNALDERALGAVRAQIARFVSAHGVPGTPLEALVAERVIPSAEELARVLPQLTAHVRAQTLPDEAGRRLYAAMYMAFRRRRGLLLVNYQHQVRFHELPWVAAMENARSTDAAQAARARRVGARTPRTHRPRVPRAVRAGDAGPRARHRGPARVGVRGCGWTRSHRLVDGSALAVTDVNVQTSVHQPRPTSLT